MYEFLRKVPLFADLPDEDLQKLYADFEVVKLDAGEILFEEGDPGDRAYLVQEGEIEVIKNSGGRQVLLAVRGVGTLVGEIALLEEGTRSATVRAGTDTTLLAIRQEHLEKLISNSATAARAMFETMLARWRNTNALLHQSEKMAQLGTLTAGVAHELNNPAAAVKRGADQLGESLAEYGDINRSIAQAALPPDRQQIVDKFLELAREAATHVSSADPLARSDREYEVETWLEDHGVAEPWELAPALVDLDLEDEQLQELGNAFDAELLSDVIGWLVSTYNVHNLMAEISQGATRISEIVKALKQYAYLDQAPVQTVDIHEGIDNTLLILRSKLRDRIRVIRNYGKNVTKIEAYASELNQVWTNLIDNAVDALENTERPQITITTRCDGDWVVVTVEDNGPGIPRDVQGRIFEAFFTTKGPGKGTGLGLEITYNIVVHHHRGDIKVFSEPGHTSFQVSLPVRISTKNGDSAPLVAVEKVTDEELRHIFDTTKTIAVVGISSRPERTAHSAPAYMQSQGYKIIPIKPDAAEVLGERPYPSLTEAPKPIDLVLLYVRSDEVPPYVEEAIAIGAKTIWMHEGSIHQNAAELARRAGLNVVVDACIRNEHQRLMNAAMPVGATC